MRCVVDCINESECTGIMGQADGLFDVVDCSERVGCSANCDEFCLASYQALKISPFELTSLDIHFYKTHCNAPLAFQSQPGIDVAVMNELGNHNFVTTSPLKTKRSR